MLAEIDLAPVEPVAPVAASRPSGAAVVSSASLEVLRIVFGLIGAASAARFLAKGWVESLYLAPAQHLTYPGFDWVAPAPGRWAYVHVGVVALAGLAVAAGWRTKLALGVFLVGFAWMELIDAALYLNHYWLVTLLAVLLLALPVGRRWSVDVAVGRVERATAVPAWMVWAARGQVAVVYVFAGIAKLNVDWLVRAEPLGMWLAARTDRPVIGEVLGLAVTAHVAAWVSALFDLTIVGWLLWRRSRAWAYVAVVVFHLGTAMLFQIGLFPWMMIALTPIFFAPTWPERGAAPAPVVAPERRWLSPAIAVLVAVNVIVPLRHWAYAGDVRENEVGYYGSFRVMLTEKTGVVTFNLHDPVTGESWTVDPMTVFVPWQVSQLAARADLLVTAGHIVAAQARAAGHEMVEVRADGWVSINGQQRQRTVDPTLDLAAETRRPR